MSAPVTDSSRRALTEHIRERAHALGFDVVRVTSAEPFPETERALHERIGAGLMGGLDWFTAERAERLCQPARLAAYRPLRAGVGNLLSDRRAA